MLVPLRKLVHPTDLTQEGQAAFALALKLALGAHARLVLAHVDAAGVQPGWHEFPRVRATLAAWGALPADAASEQVAELGLGVEKWRLEGDPLLSLAERIKAVEPDLLVMSTHARRGIERLVRGSVAEPLARVTRVPTLFVPVGASPCVDSGSGRTALRRVLFPVEAPLAPPPRGALGLAAALAAALGVERPVGELLHVGQGTPLAPKDLAGWSWEARAVEGEVVERIAEAARGAQLVVMTTRGHDGLLDTILGSTVERLLREVSCPVLAVPAPSE